MVKERLGTPGLASRSTLGARLNTFRAHRVVLDQS